MLREDIVDWLHMYYEHKSTDSFPEAAVSLMGFDAAANAIMSYMIKCDM